MTQPGFWARLRIDNIILHGLRMRDAALVGLQYMAKAYPDEPKRLTEWRKLARALHIPVAEDPQLKAERLRREQAKVREEFGDG